MSKSKRPSSTTRATSNDDAPAVMEQFATTWGEAETAVSTAQDTQGMVFYYRGQSSAAWDLKPSLLRLFEELDLRGPAALEVEKDALVDFKRRSRLWLRSELLPSQTDSAIAWWPLMQHYSCPTRLLDWTRSPWVALYFAAYHHFDHDGVIWSFLPSPLRRAQNRTRRRFTQQPLDTGHEEDVFVVEEAVPTERLEAQQGIFTVATSPLIAQDEHLSCLRRIVIKASIKQECLFRLKAMNITAASLFPGLDGLGKGVAEEMRLTSWTRQNHNQHMLAVCQNVQRAMKQLGSK